MKIQSIEELVPHLYGRFQQGRLSHAYVVDGINPSLQLSYLAKMEKDLSGRGISDIHVIHVEEGKSIQIDDVRLFTQRLTRKPIGQCHWVLLPFAELMNTSAANSLLKTLEEPAGQTCFILLTRRASYLMPTIRSRVQYIYFKPKYDFEGLDKRTKRLYSICTNELGLEEKDRLVPLLHGLMESPSKLDAIIAMGIKDGRALLQALIHLLAVFASEGEKSPVIWEVYDEVLYFYQLHARKAALNHNALVDRVAYWLDRISQVVSV